jgi:hypothetical protein
VHPADYGRFVSAAAQRYSPGGVFGSHVRAWEIWNEPNGPGFGPDPDPVKYTTMLKLAAVAIRAVNPTAQILTGGVAPAPDLPDGQSYAPATFLNAIYRNGGHGSFTAVANHPYSGNYAPMFRAEWNAFYTTPKLHRIMTSHGDGNKKIWGTEFGYASSLVFGVGEAMQAALLGIGIVLWQRWSFTGPLFVFNLRDESAIDVGKFDTTGMLHYDSSRKPAWKMFKFLARAYPQEPAGLRSRV